MQLLRGKEIAVNVLRPSFQVWGCGPVFGRPVSFYLRNSFVLQRKIVKVFCLIFFALQAKGLRGINETYKSFPQTQMQETQEITEQILQFPSCSRSGFRLV